MRRGSLKGLSAQLLRITLFTTLLVGLIPSIVYAAVGDAVADRVLGQTTFVGKGWSTLPNRLHAPTGVYVDRSSNRIFVADRQNGRVVSWPNAATFPNGATPDITITNSGSVTVTLDPVAVTTDAGGNLYVADPASSRVLRYNAPISNGMAPTLVIGQHTFTDIFANQGISIPLTNTLNGPFSVAVSTSGTLFVADQSNNRVLGFSPPFSTNMSASLVIGQANFTSGGINRGNGPTSAASNSLNNPQGVALDAAGNLFVSDTYNHRILRFSPPFSNGMSANLVLGQANFTSNQPNRGGATPNAQTLNMPVGLAIDSVGHLHVGDTLNYRILGYEAGMSNGMSARLVVGQPNFGAASYDPSAPASAVSLSFPDGVAVDSYGNLYSTDRANNRVLGYDQPWASVIFLPLVRR